MDMMDGINVAVPSLDKFPAIEEHNEVPGAIIFGGGNIMLNPGRKAVILNVINRGDRPIQVLLLLLQAFLSKTPCFCLTIN